MNKSFRRKIIYILAIIGLLLPLYALGRPKVGAISLLRDRHNMGQTYLGELDPTSESMRLATLGLKGPAASILWLRADYYKEEKYFDRFKATLNQIAKLQPHFISVWQHQAHNLSFNVSPEFEDYRQRYEWVKKGIDYLVQGTKYNTKKPILQYDLGHYVGNKIGKFDEKKQYRELFRKDNEFHQYFAEQGLAIETDGVGYDQRPDNWLVGKLWFKVATDSYQRGNRIAKSPHLLYSYFPLWQMYYGEAMQTEGVLDDSCRFAWEQGGREWAEFGNVSLPWSGDGQIRLLDSATEGANIDAVKKDFNQKTADIRKRIFERRFARLPDSMKAAYSKPAEERTLEERELAMEAERMSEPPYQEVVAECPKETQVSLLQITTDLAQREEKLRITNIYRQNVNYPYWELRAQAEQKPYMVDARRLLYEADKMIDSADIKGALENYDKAWTLWNITFQRFPSMMTDTEEVGDSVAKSINRYKKLMEDELAPDFVLNWFLDYYKTSRNPTLGMEGEKMMDEFNKRAALFKDEPSFTQSAEAIEYFNVRIPKPSAGKENAPSNDGESPSDSASARPPKLENPDSQR
ncbi:MAG: hypothetical protein KGQ60_03600 [Planctomycetes bacterium]|nr:hypothetical protein [Planctomycetota bacterium]